MVLDGRSTRRVTDLASIIRARPFAEALTIIDCDGSQERGMILVAPSEIVSHTMEVLVLCNVELMEPIDCDLIVSMMPGLRTIALHGVSCTFAEHEPCVKNLEALCRLPSLEWLVIRDCNLSKVVPTDLRGCACSYVAVEGSVLAPPGISMLYSETPVENRTFAAGMARPRYLIAPEMRQLSVDHLCCVEVLACDVCSLPILTGTPLREGPDLTLLLDVDDVRDAPDVWGRLSRLSHALPNIREIIMKRPSDPGVEHEMTRVLHLIFAGAHVGTRTAEYFPDLFFACARIAVPAHIQDQL